MSGHIIQVDRTRPYDLVKYYPTVKEDVWDIKNLMQNRPLGDTLNLAQLRRISPQQKRHFFTHMDTHDFMTMWENRAHVPEKFQGPIPEGYTFFEFYFWASSLTNVFGVEYVLHMRWAIDYDDKKNFAPQWTWGVTPRDHPRATIFPALACLV